MGGEIGWSLERDRDGWEERQRERGEEGERARGKSAQIFFYDDNCRSLQLNPT